MGSTLEHEQDIKLNDRSFANEFARFFRIRGRTQKIDIQRVTAVIKDILDTW